MHWRIPVATLSSEVFLGSVVTVRGVQMGNVWIGVQPMLGVEGDPMRLLFDRDLTPHPQYAALYHHLTHTLDADALVHFGMHGDSPPPTVPTNAAHVRHVRCGGARRLGETFD